MRTTKHYAVVYEKGPSNWSAHVPDLPGCVSVGDTREDAERNIREAIELYIEVSREYGDPIPEPSAEVGMVTVAA